jgi:hypothetical protein
VPKNSINLTPKEKRTTLVRFWDYCTIAAIDGLTFERGTDFRDVAYTWAESYPRMRQAIMIAAPQHWDKSITYEMMPPWELVDYLNAVKHDEIWEQSKDVFIRCASCQEAFPEILNGSDYMELRESVVIWKYFYAGISSGFMFECTVKEIDKFVLDAFTKLQGPPGPDCAAAYDLLIYQTKNDFDFSFTSILILQKYHERQDILNKRCLFLPNNQYFKFTCLKAFKGKESFTIKIHQNSEDEPIKMAGTIKSTILRLFIS